MWPISTRVNKPENDDPSILFRLNAVLETAALPVSYTPTMVLTLLAEGEELKFHIFQF